MHVESTGSEAGDELVDEVDEVALAKDMSRILDVQEVLVDIIKKNGTNDEIMEKFNQMDFESLERVWNVEIQARQEFGFPQVQRELVVENKVSLDLNSSLANSEEGTRLELKYLEDRLRSNLLPSPQARSDTDGEGN